MATIPQMRTRHTNPRLAYYLAIFASAFVALIVVALILSQMEDGQSDLGAIVVILPVVAMVMVGALSYCGDVERYYSAARRVPAFFSGLATASITLGAAGVSGFAGALLIVGFDAFAIAVGLLLGVLVLAVLIAPYFRKYGGHTLAGFLGRRFQSRRVRVLVALVTAVPLTLLVAGELKILSDLVARHTGRETASVLPLMAFAVALAVGLGGMRGASATGAAGGLTLLLAVVVPIAIVAVMRTNLPLAPLVYGNDLSGLASREAALGLVRSAPMTLDVGLPGVTPLVITQPFLERFSSLGVGGFLLLAFTIMAGVAAMPSVVARAATTPTVLQTRKAMGWAVVVAAVIVLFLPAGAVFARHYLLDIGQGVDNSWFTGLARLAIAAPVAAPPAEGYGGWPVARDGALMLLPAVARLPEVLVFAVGAGLVVTAFAAASAHALAIGTSLADDLVLAYAPEEESELARSVLPRLVAAGAIAVGAMVAARSGTDPFRLMLLALSMIAGSVFPVVVMAIWWKRFSTDGATLALVLGFGLTAGYAILSDIVGLPRILMLDPVAAGLVGAVAGGLGGVLASLMGPKTSQETREFVRDIRMPGGETVFDRERRLAAASRRRRATANVGAST
ncbi:MAG: hypothetical protein GC150_16005 [Rhizobiales bacterium]|nr:hypothetical protein [Hyphomicrobiales bacterium]